MAGMTRRTGRSGPKDQSGPTGDAERTRLTERRDRARGLRHLPFAVTLMGIGAAAMLVPAIHAWGVRDWDDARVFLWSALLFLGLFALLATALSGRTSRNTQRDYLAGLAAAYTLLPLMLAVPFHQAVGDTRFAAAWFEMVSSITTTGATLYEDPARLSDTQDFWRVFVGWLGGLLIWVAAWAILAPMNLGGFEVTDAGQSDGPDPSSAAPARAAIRPHAVSGEAMLDPGWRMARALARMGPIYGGLTLLLVGVLSTMGVPPFVAICTAMSTLATSGILPAGTDGGGTGIGGALWPAEVAVFAFLIFAVSRRTFGVGAGERVLHGFWRDRELRIAAVCVVVLPLALFARHWVGALEDAAEADVVSAAAALWGAVFTVLSFLTTTGFVSAAWESSRAWSGLETPGMILMGLALVGGGVATTAGGVKLLRIHALYQHGLREMEKLVHPNSVGGTGRAARRVRRRGAYVAWIFFMLFALSTALTMSALSLTGIPFDAAVILTVAALSTTGPLAGVGGEAPILYSTLDGTARMILALAMALGRLETLAVIALLNPAFWRR